MPAKTYKKGISHPLLLGVETDPTCQKFNLATQCFNVYPLSPREIIKEVYKDLSTMTFYSTWMSQRSAKSAKSLDKEGGFLKFSNMYIKWNIMQ